MGGDWLSSSRRKCLVVNSAPDMVLIVDGYKIIYYVAMVTASLYIAYTPHQYST